MLWRTKRDGVQRAGFSPVGVGLTQVDELKCLIAAGRNICSTTDGSNPPI